MPLRVGGRTPLEIVEARDVVKEYSRGDVRVRALQGVSMKVDSGSMVSIVGASGAGKSTLLHLIGTLDTPTAGTLRIDGLEVGCLSEEATTLIRRHTIGFVFQFFNLIPTLRAWENVAVPALLDGRARTDQVRERARALLERVGIEHRAEHRPAQLSGGEMQRVALARALMNDPPLILADEPTGNLDSETGAQILDLLRDLATVEGKAVVMVTHNPEAAHRGDRVLELVDGQVAREWTPRPVQKRRSVASR